MIDLKLHATGENDYLKSLKEDYEYLKKKLINNDRISEIEKKVELKKIIENFEKDKKDLKHKLF